MKKLTEEEIMEVDESSRRSTEAHSVKKENYEGPLFFRGHDSLVSRFSIPNCFNRNSFLRKNRSGN